MPHPHANATRTARTPRIVLLPLVITAILIYTATPGVGQAVTLGHPTVEQRISKLGVDPADGYRFVMFGDQKGLWKRDFPEVLKRISQLAADKSHPPLLFMVDTGDIVVSGLKAKQFTQLKKILSPVADLPYLVAVGNHELKPKQSKGGGRRNTAAFLAGVDPNLSPDRMYYTKTVGPVRFLFLNSNDFPAAYDPQPGVAARGRAQMDWLEKQLQTDTYTTLALMHHPFVQSCDKHQEQATRLWNYPYPDRGSRTLAEILIDGGVDLVFTGHVHSYETFRLERAGKRMWTLNASGKPSGFYSKGRTPRNWSGREMEELAKHDFTTRLDQWQITQTDYMHGDEVENQYAVVTVDREGNLDIEVHFLKSPKREHKMRIEKN